MPSSKAEDRKADAEARKLEVETELMATKIAAEVEKLKAEARNSAASAAKSAAEADEALERAHQERMKAKVAQIAHDREHEKRQRELADFRHGRVYVFDGAVKSDSVANCVRELRYWSQIDPGCDIEIMFDSPGGSVFDGLALYDYIQELKRAGHNITTSTRGMAASMGGILLQAGNKRVMGAEAWILIHEISTVTGGKIGDIEDEVELIKKIQGRVLDIFASRSNGKISKQKLQRAWRRKDWWVDSTEAMKLGLVDEVR